MYIKNPSKAQMRATTSPHLNIYVFIHSFCNYNFNAFDFEPTKA